MKKKIIAILLTSTITFGWLPVTAYSADSQTMIETSYKTGTYELNNSILKTDSDADSAARKYVDSTSTITINKNDLTASITFNQKSLMSNIVVKVNGSEVSYTSVEEENTNLKITFSLNSINDNIEVSSLINTGFFKLNVSFRVLFDTSSLPIDEESPKQEGDSQPGNDGSNEGSEEETNEDDNGESGGTSSEQQKPSIPQPPVQNPPVQDPPEQPAEDPEVPEAPATEEEKAPVANTPPSSGTTQSYSIYKIKNQIITSSAVGYSAARSAVNNYSYVEKIDGILYVTLGISQLDVMSNIRVYVNGSKVNYEILRQSEANHTMDIRYKLKSLSDTVNISAHIDMMDMDISFGLGLLEDTMTLINSTSAAKPLAQKTESTVLDTINNSSDSKSEDNTAADSDTSSETEDLKIEVKSYFKKYTIENDIISDSSIGKNMARKYIDKTSILEDIDGQLYLTLVLSDSSAMSNIKIKVNNEEIKYSKTVSDGKVSYKFKLNSITDDIKISMTITVVNKEVEFGIDLLEDTMTLIEEKTIEQEEKETLVTKVANPSAENIAAAASPVNTTKIILISIISTIIAIGLIEAIIFAFIKKKKVN